LVLLFIIGCNGNAQNNENDTLAQAEQTATNTPMPEPTPTNTEIPIPEATFTPTVEPTSTPTPRPPWVWHEAGTIKAPILLYHHVDLNSSGYADRYYISPEDFEIQMRALAAQGYETVTIDYLVDVIWSGGLMPEKPVVLTFDDGQLSVYENAYPIMKELGFVGSIYYVASWFGSEVGMNNSEIQELVDAGWSLGSHSYTHRSMIAAYLELQYEMRQSKLKLEELFGVEVNTFAYPFGDMDEYAGRKVGNYGYTGAVGLGDSVYQGLYNIYYLSRIEIYGTTSLVDFLGIISD